LLDSQRANVFLGGFTKRKKRERRGAKMRRLVAVTLMLLLLAVSGQAHASSVSKSVGVTAVVDPRFTFALDTYSIDMGTIAPGGEGGGVVTLYCGSNQGRRWLVGVWSSGLVSQSGTEISLSKFSFCTYGVGDEAGVGTYQLWVPFTLSQGGSFSYIAYRPAPSEYSDPDVRIQMGFKVNVPWNTPAGIYSATVHLTMVEW
jgi:hypothetical protein